MKRNFSPGEICGVGSVIGGKFVNIPELHPMKYKEVMSRPSKEKREQYIKDEHDRMEKHKVWKEC